jgi:hypothetical protein
MRNLTITINEETDEGILQTLLIIAQQIRSGVKSGGDLDQYHSYTFHIKEAETPKHNRITLRSPTGLSTRFVFTHHFRQRYCERILGLPLGTPLPGNLDALISVDLNTAVERTKYMQIPAFLLHLWEKHGGINGVSIFESKQTVFLTAKDKNSEERVIRTCWPVEGDFFFGPEGVFTKPKLSSSEIWVKIGIAKQRNKK